MAPRIFAKCLLGVCVLATASNGSPNTSKNAAILSCKYIPGDAGYPSQHQWASLNATVGGRLVMSQLEASICHTRASGTQLKGPYSATGCDDLKGIYDTEQAHQNYSAEILNPYFQGTSCSPWSPPNQTCELGNYVSYAINVSGAADVVAGINFSQKHNVRLVVKNTGHDYLGRSTGKGALSLWTHNLQGYEIIKNYTSENYTGPAVKLAAGTQGYQALDYLHEDGYRIVSGECPTVGVAGGYTAGGGHSMLSSRYGMAADSVLEWEVVTPQGKHVIAKPHGEYSDLFWAMTGGGGGTWGVVLSMTTKIYPESIIGAARFSFNSTGVSAETYWNATAMVYAFMVEFTDKGNTFSWGQTNTTFTGLSVTMPDQDSSQVSATWAALLKELDNLGIMYTFEPRVDDNYYNHFSQDYGPLPYGDETAATAIFTGRLIPRALVADPASSESKTVIDAIRDITNVQTADFTFGCNAISVGNWSGVDNAVLPTWRDAVAFCVIVTPWDRSAPFEHMVGVKKLTVDQLVPALEKATPGGGIYMNELDPLYHGDWVSEGYGDNYGRLLSIKKKYDPDHVFWSPMSVSGGDYTTDAAGRVCKA